MAKKKFTELPAVTTPLDGTEILALVQGGVSKKATVDDLPAGAGGGTVDSVAAGNGISVDATDPANPIVTNDGVLTVQGAMVDNTDPQNPQIGYPAASNVSFTPAGGIAATDVQSALVELDGDKADITQVVGVQDLFISAAAMWPRTTNPCADLAKTEMTTSLFNIQSLDFDQTTQEFAQFQIVLPRKYNNGTVTAVFYWTAASGSGDVQWGISGGAYSNDDALTVALGTAQTVDDTLITANDLHITSATSAITLAGTPASADFLAFQISRNPASDTLTADAKLLGVSIRVTTSAAIDA